MDDKGPDTQATMVIDAPFLSDSLCLSTRAHSLAQEVAAMESKAAELDQVRATLLVNFGREHGRHEAGVVADESQGTLQLLVDVLQQLKAKAEQPEQQDDGF